MDDMTLYRQYLSGDGAALEALLEQYGDRLTLYINGYVKNMHDAEDLLIDVFAYLIVRRPHIKSSFRSYLYKAARNHALMFLRKRRRFYLLSEQQVDFYVEHAFEDAVVERERNEQLYRCMQGLHSAQREALYLVYMEGLSYQDAASVLHKTVKQIDKLLQLGKKNIRPLLEREGIQNEFNG